MSWRVDGVYYHSREEYERALREREHRNTAERLQSLQREFQRQQAQATKTEAQIREVHDDYERQIALTAKLSSQISEQQRTVRRLRETQESTLREMEEGFSDLRSCVQATQEEITSIQEFQRSQVVEVRRRFESVEDEMREGLATAEERRRQLENELKQSIRTIDDRLSSEINDRLKRESDRATQTQIVAEIVDEEVDKLLEHAEKLGLEGEIDGIQQHLVTARRHLKHGDSTVALSHAETAHSEVRSLRFEAKRRKSRLEVTQSNISERIERMHEVLKSDIVSRCFPLESKKISAYLDRIGRDLSKRFKRYAAIEVDVNEANKAVDDVEFLVFLIESIQDNVEKDIQARDSRMLEIVEELMQPQALGTLVDKPIESLEIPGDPKSNKLLSLQFQSGKVILRVPLDPTKSFSLDGFGHRTDQECSTAFRPIQETIAKSLPLAQANRGDARLTESNVQRADSLSEIRQLTERLT